jgi:hypothetical protein
MYSDLKPESHCHQYLLSESVGNLTIAVCFQTIMKWLSKYPFILNFKEKYDVHNVYKIFINIYTVESRYLKVHGTVVKFRD